MAFIFGVASQEADLYKILRDFVTGCGRPGKIVRAGTGTGEVNNLIFPLSSTGAYETFTLTCVSTAARGGTFGVVGSASGTLPDAVVGQVYKHAKIEFYLDFGPVDYELGDTFTITCASKPSGKAGFGRFGGGPQAVTETWTLLCTSPGQQEIEGVQPFIPAVFSVTGSVTGGLADLTQGVNYENSSLRLRVANDPTSSSQYIVGETITFEMTINPLRALGQHWATLRKTPDNATLQFGKAVEDTDLELILVGPGLSGDDAVYWGMTRAWNDASAYAVWTHWGMSGYIPSMPINEQPLVQGGQSGVKPIHTFWSQQVPYTIIASGRCFKVLTRSNTYYSQSYQGLYLPSTLPKYNGYPYFSGGTGDTRSTFWSALSSNRASFWNYLGDTNGCSAYALTEVKGWPAMIGERTEQSGTIPNYYGPYAVWPYHQRGMYDMRLNLDGSLPMFQCQLTPNMGFLDGVYAIPGRDGRQPEEIVVNRDGRRMVVVQNHHRAGFNDFCAFTLE